MQTVIQVIATGTGSLRNKIMSDPQLEKNSILSKSGTNSRAVPMAGRKYSRTELLMILSIICWRDIKAVFLQFISCADKPDAVRFAASLGVNYSTVTLFARLRGLS